MIEKLTRRQAEVLLTMAQDGNWEEMGIGKTTWWHHVQGLKDTLGAEHTGGLVARGFALRYLALEKNGEVRINKEMVDYHRNRKWKYGVREEG